MRREDFFSITANMPEISQQHVEKLAALITGLRSILDDVSGQPIDVPPHIREAVARYVAEGRCLRCEQKKQGRYTRGLDANCYNKTIKEINSGAVTEADVIRMGRITPAPKPGGRQTTIPPLSELSPLAGEPEEPIARAHVDQLVSDVDRPRKRAKG